jgi:hypothetical protein
MISTGTAFQATDLARSHRQVLDAAREGTAFIRDKDGVVLSILRADDLERTFDVADLAVDLVRVSQSLLERDAPTSAARLGRFGWLSTLPLDSQRIFFQELSEVFLVAASGLSLRPVELLIQDWRATAESWADPDARAQLLADEDEPLASVTL